MHGYLRCFSCMSKPTVEGVPRGLLRQKKSLIAGSLPFWAGSRLENPQIVNFRS